jgi:hypothetical protein
MNANHSVDQGLPAKELAGVFWFVALALFGLFVSLAAASLLPPRPASPAWLMMVSQSLVSLAPLPLLGLCLARIALVLDSANPWLQRQCGRVSRLAFPVALGFFLLVPLQGYALLAQNKLANQRVDQHIDQTLARLERIRSQVQASTDLQDLAQRMKVLGVPVRDLAGGASDFPLLRLKLLNSLDESSENVAKTRKPGMALSPRQSLLQALLRGILPAIVIGLAFLPFAATAPALNAVEAQPEDGDNSEGHVY